MLSTPSFNPVTINNAMETGSHVAHLPATCSPRLARFGQQLEPLLPGKYFYSIPVRQQSHPSPFHFAGKDNKRKRLNAVLDKLASNITKVSDDASPEDLDSPGDKSLEFELNVKTKIKKEESCEDTSGESDDNAAAGDLAASSSPGLGLDTSPRLASTPTKEDAEAVTSPDKLSDNTFFKSLLLKSPKCDRKQEVSR